MMCMPVYTPVEARPKKEVGHLLSFFTLLTLFYLLLNQSLSLNLKLTIWIGWLVSELQASPVSAPPPALRLKICASVLPSLA